jgi:hypothetical protein
MPPTNPSAATAAIPQGQLLDTQQLVALLGSLMPLLANFQPQTAGPSPGSGPLPTAAADPALDYQAAVNLAENITADSLRTLCAYLETYARGHSGLGNCLPIVTHAAHSFAARDYAQAFNHIWQAYRVIAMARAFDPQLPPARANAPAAAQTSAASASMH